MFRIEDGTLFLSAGQYTNSTRDLAVVKRSCLLLDKAVGTDARTIDTMKCTIATVRDKKGETI